ncbi:MAG TPA: hypothetical protein VJM77_05595 [Nitrospiria bacterium]|jgi:hypothetical protein|nr:hypothetical protein [Nitrospiria bacterium]
MKISLKQIVLWCVEYWGRFSTRERIFLSVGAVLTIALLGYHFLVSPFVDRLRMLDRLTIQKEKEIVELSQLREQYLILQRKISAVEGRIAKSEEGFSLFSYLEGISVKNQVKDRIVFIRPQPSQVFGDYREIAVEVKVENVTLAQVVNLLDAIQGSPQFLRIKRAQFKTRYNDPRLLDGTFVVSSYEKVL